MTTPTLDRRVRVGDWLVPYDDATQEVRLNRTVSDILKATPGDDADCMNSRCIQAQRHEHLFPHPVLLVSTIKSRVYIVDALDDKGDPAHAIRYELSERDSGLIDAHDRFGVGEPGELRLRVPSDPKGSPKRASAGGNRYGRTPGRYSGDGSWKRESQRPVNSTSNGARARYLVAVGMMKDAAK